MSFFSLIFIILHSVYVILRCIGICDENTCPYLGQVCRVAADGQSPECACRCQGPECLAPGVICDTNGKTHQSFAEFAIWKCESQNYEVEKDYFGACEGKRQADAMSIVAFMHSGKNMLEFINVNPENISNIHMSNIPCKSMLFVDPLESNQEEP